MKNENIFFLDVDSEYKTLIKKRFPGSKIFDQVLKETDLINLSSKSEILCVSYKQKVTKKVISSLKNLKLIITRSVGYDNIDIKSANKNKVIVCNVSDYGPHVIAEFVFALLLSGLRRVREGDERVEDYKQYSLSGLKGMTLKGKTLGIIGLGKIGTEVSKIASLGFSMNVIAYDLKPNKKLSLKYNFKYSNLNDLYKKSDIITLHCPLNSKTKYLINKNSIKKMKDEVILVNTSRGGLINTKDLTLALKSGKISSVFLDVLEHEENLKKYRELIDIPGVITTPHIAGYADNSREKMYKIAIQDIKNFLNKKRLQNVVSTV